MAFAEKLIAVVTAVVLVAVAVQATDSDPLQDFCVADIEAGVFVNGYPCKDPSTVTTEDFAFSGLAHPLEIDPRFDSKVTPGKVVQWPALNTLGLTIARLDILPGGVIVPHTHNLATEILYCLEGEIYTGFVSNIDNPAAPNKLFAKVVKKGEAFIFPRGLVHFQLNMGDTPAVSLNVLNSQNPGFQLLPEAMFATNPPIDPELLAKSFFITEEKVAELVESQCAMPGPSPTFPTDAFSGPTRPGIPQAHHHGRQDLEVVLSPMIPELFSR